MAFYPLELTGPYQLPVNSPVVVQSPGRPLKVLNNTSPPLATALILRLKEVSLRRRRLRLLEEALLVQLLVVGRLETKVEELLGRVVAPHSYELLRPVDEDTLAQMRLIGADAKPLEPARQRLIGPLVAAGQTSGLYDPIDANSSPNTFSYFSLKTKYAAITRSATSTTRANRPTKTAGSFGYSFARPKATSTRASFKSPT